MEVLKLSWKEIEDIARGLAEKIKTEGFAPDYLIGIATGGLVPLYYLAKELENDNLLTVSASSYEKDKQGELVIKYLPEVDLKGKNVLLVDEIAESGETIKQISEAIIKKYSVVELKTVTLAINKTKCQFKPDYYSVEDDRWVVFPWEKKDFPEYF